MRMRKWLAAGVLVVLVAAYFTGCDDDRGDGRPPPGVEADVDYTGRYYVAVGHSPAFTMDIVHSEDTIIFSLTGKNVLLEGTGVVTGTIVTLSAEIEGMGDFTGVIEFSGDGSSFSGTWEIVGDNPVQGTITGTRTPWATYDVNVLGVPVFAGADCIELDKIREVSKLRSGTGHDYSDDFEACRSMKHYYNPKDGVERTSVRLFSPVTGTVIGTTEEWDGPSVYKGTVVGIRPQGYEAFDVVIFHINLYEPLAVGDTVVVGQELGTSQKTSGTVTDVAFGVHTPGGHKLFSYFEAMDASVFALYQARGAGSRDDFIITREERDADPLTCIGEEFADGGTLENWVTLTD